MTAAVRAACQLPADPIVHSAEGEVWPLLEAALLEHPLPLRGGEVAVEDETGTVAHEGEMAGSFQFLTPGGRPAILPDDRPVERPAGGEVPCDSGLPLVGDADSSHRRAVPAAALGHPGAQLGERRLDELPDLCRVVLDPTRSGKCWVSSR